MMKFFVIMDSNIGSRENLLISDLLKNFSSRIFDYPAFGSYIKEFYPDYTQYKIKQLPNKSYVVVIYFDFNHNVIKVKII